MNPFIESLIRHGLNSGGAFLATKGIIGGNQTEAVVGLGLSLAQYVWSLIAAKTSKVKLEKAIAAPAGKAE